jgi:hypothetical protein
MSLSLDGSTGIITGLDIPTSQLPGGSILQVVQNTNSTSTVASTTTYQDSSLSASITPSSSSSKILIIISQAGHVYSTTGANRWGSIRILRDATEIHEIEQALGGRGGLSGGDRSDSASISVTFLDSPATTSSVTYKTQGKVNGTLCNYTFQVSGSTSVITLLEVAG